MKTKRILSLLLCLAMLCGLMTVTSISASADDVAWETMYDWENGDTSMITAQGQSLALNGGAFTAGIPSSTTAISFQGNYQNCNGNTVVGWIRIPMTDLIDNATNIRVPLSFAYNGQGSGFIGVEIDGVAYWHAIKNRGLDWFSYVGTTMYTNMAVVYENWDHWGRGSGDTVEITSENVSSIDALYFSWYDSYQIGLIDDIQVEVPAAAPKATFDNGVADVKAVGGKVTMPETTIAGKQFIGWQNAQGDLYAAGAEVAITEDTAFTAVVADVALQTGAGIRWAEREQERGIRFETYVTKAALDTIGSSSFVLGALILPYADYNADITVETASAYGAINVVDPKVYGEVGENYRYYTGVVDFEKYFAVSQAALADLKLTAVSYVKITYADGSVGYFYDHPDAVNNVRSVAEVARAAKADTAFGYTDAQMAILDLYTQYSRETSVPEYRKDDADKIAEPTTPPSQEPEDPVNELDALLGMSKKTVGDTLKSPITNDTYTLKFIDDFGGTSIDTSNWSYFTRNYNASEESVNRKENVIVENGLLNIYGKKEDQTYTGGAESWETPKVSNLTGGAINSQGKKEYKYGRLEIYCKIPYSRGIWPAFWTMGTQRGWPWGGEIDIMEFVGGTDEWGNYRDDEYNCGIHWADPNTSSEDAWGGAGHLTASFGSGKYEIPGGPDKGAKLHDNWYVCGLEWNETTMYTYCNGDLIGSIDITQHSMREAFHQSHYMILNLVMGGSWAGHPSEDNGTVFPQVFQIDWVKVWQK